MSQNISYDDNYELFKQYQVTKSVDLRNEIALKNKNLIYRGIRGLYSPNVNDPEELEQEAFILLLKAVETFDINKGYKFSTYAISCMRAVTRNRLDYNKDVSLDEPLQNQEDDDISMVDLIEDETIDIQRDCINEDIRNNLKKVLTDFEYKVIKLYYIEEYSFNQIGKAIDIPKKQVVKIKNNAERKIYKSKYFKEYREEALYYNELTYLKAIDYSLPKVQNSDISNPVMEAVLKREKRDYDILRNAILGK